MLCLYCLYTLSIPHRHSTASEKRHRGEVGHNQDTRDTRTHGAHRRTSQPSLTTIPTHKRTVTHAHPREARRPTSPNEPGADRACEPAEHLAHRTPWPTHQKRLQYVSTPSEPRGTGNGFIWTFQLCRKSVENVQTVQYAFA